MPRSSRLGRVAAGLALALWLALVPGPARADYQSAVLAYETGDFRGALKEFRRLASHGHAGAEFMLGAMYFYGKGVRRNDPVAAIWFQKAAVKGNANAMLAFGSIYFRGLGVRQDLVQAYMWLDLASTVSEHPDLRQQAVQLRHEAARLMQPAEVERAQANADAWRPTISGFSVLE